MITHHLSLLMLIAGILSGDSFRSFSLPRMKRTFSKIPTMKRMCYADEDDGDGGGEMEEQPDTYDADEFEFPEERQSIYPSSSVKDVEVR